MPKEEFNKPIGKWIEEEEDVERIVHSFDPQTRKITEETKTDKQKVKVIYERTKIEELFCEDFEHEFMVVDSHNYVIKCKKCPLHKHIMPGQEYIDKEGHVRSRSNDEVIA